MAEQPIEQPIRITGDQEVLAVLKSIGEAGREAFNQIADATKGVAPAAKRTTEDLNRIEGASRDLGRSIRVLGEGFGGLAREMVALGKAAGVLTGALVGVTKVAAANAAQAKDQSQVLSITTEEYGRLSYALKQSGADIGTAQQSLFRLTNLIKEAGEGNEEASETFRKFGIRVKDGSGQLRSTADVLGELADTFKAMSNDARKTSLAIELFGQRAGPKLVPFLNEGRAGIKALGDEAARMGIVFDQEGASLGKKFDDSLTKLGASISGITNTIGLAFFPVFTEIADGLAEFIASLREPIGNIASFIAQELSRVVSVFRSTVLPVFQSIYSAIDTLVQAFNDLFGTNIDTKTLIVAAAFTVLGGVIAKLASSVISLVPALGPLLRFFIGFPSLAGTFASVLRVVIGSVGALANILRIGLLVFGGWPAILIAVGVAIGYFITKYLSSGVWRQHLEAIHQAFASVWNQIAGAWNSVGASFQAGWETVKGYFNDGIEAIKTIFSDAWSGITSRWGEFVSGINEAWESIKQKAVDIWNEITAYVLEKINQIKNAFSGLFGGGEVTAAEGGLVTFAGGGYVRGPGTSTSDSIPARLSRGEFVQRAAAVRKYGVGFMNAINSLRFPKDLVPSFALGGLVDMPSPSPVMKFAEGGSVGSPRNVLNLTLDGETFSNLGVPDDSFEKLKKKAIRKSMSPRTPNWYKG